jgi:phosphatidylglycerophosphatase A
MAATAGRGEGDAIDAGIGSGAAVSWRKRLAVGIATAAGLGYFPVVPGTAGAALGVLLIWLSGRLPLARSRVWAVDGAVAVALFFAGVWASGRSEPHFGRTDPGEVVVDEVVGQMLTLLVAPGASWKLLLAGFVLFRILDVAKPFPAGRAERLPGGWGIMVDDVVAGAYGLGAWQVVALWLR